LNNKNSTRSLLTPDNLAMLQAVALHGSLAAAARALGVVPSALTYRVRQIEDGLDVLLFDRSSRRASLTPAGQELITHGGRILADLDAVAQRVKRVATGWEPQLRIAVESLLCMRTVHELCEAFFALEPPTEIKIQVETLSGNWLALTSGRVDLALGTVSDHSPSPAIAVAPLGDIPFIFAVAPHHPLAQIAEPLSQATLAAHRAVAVADSAALGQGITVNLLSGQRVLTVPSMADKISAQLRGLGVGYVPSGMAQPYIDSGRLVQKRTERLLPTANLSYAWRSAAPKAPGIALAWWLDKLQSSATRQALLHHTLAPAM
jgi:DNA-binding transcriptional LysR family regulator